MMCGAVGSKEQKPGNSSHGHAKRVLSHDYWKKKKINIAKLFRARRGVPINSHEQDQKIEDSSLANVTDSSAEVSIVALDDFTTAPYGSISDVWIDLELQLEGNYTVQNASEASISCSAFLREKSLENKCFIIERYCEDSAGLFFNYMYIANCMLGACPFLVRLGFLLLIVAFLFYLLGDTAEEYFCPTVAKISSLLKLSPSTAGVTLLAFGNGKERSLRTGATSTRKENAEYVSYGIWALQVHPTSLALCSLSLPREQMEKSELELLSVQDLLLLQL